MHLIPFVAVKSVHKYISLFKCIELCQAKEHIY